MRNSTIGVAVAALLVAGCGGNPTASGEGAAGGTKTEGGPEQAAVKVYDEINGLSGEERTKKLVELAQKEGALSVYTSNTDLDKLVKGFEKQHDIDVQVYRGNSESVLQRVLQEQKANFQGVDLVETNALELNVRNKEGHLHPYEGELRDKVRKEGQAEGWTADRFNVFVVGWNTTKVKPGEEPTSLEDLADPKWKGQVSMELGDVDWFAALYKHYQEQGKSEEEVRKLFTDLASNSKIVKGHTVQGELLSAGQFAVGVSLYSHTVDKAAKKGAPVAWKPPSGKPVQPLVVRPNGAGLMKNATNPAAAMLFMDYLLTDGQDVVAKALRIGSVPGGDDPLAGLDVIPVPEDELLENSEKWDKLYADIVQSGQKVK
jgi:iron(III) transport system substrate-binding protein